MSHITALFSVPPSEAYFAVGIAAVGAAGLPLGSCGLRGDRTVPVRRNVRSNTPSNARTDDGFVGREHRQVHFIDERIRTAVTQLSDNRAACAVV